MPPQLKTLLTLFLIFIAIFFVIRHFLVPASFGEFGHYRGDAIIDISNKEMVFANREVCIECHSDINEKLQSDLHANLSCIVCHGPGLEHASFPDSVKIIKKSGRENCGRCHSINPARPKDMINQIDIVEHHKEKNDCIECHNPHQVWELKE
jgi:hypothetical protein